VESPGDLAAEEVQLLNWSTQDGTANAHGAPSRARPADSFGTIRVITRE
jgi:hypothetical protein